MARRNRKSNSDSYLKWKRKNWFKILAPAEFKEVELGECLIESAQDLKDRVVQANMMTLTRDIRKQNVSLKFKVIDVVDNIGRTQVCAYTMAPASVKRLVRSRRDRIDDSFIVKTKDGVTVRVKPLLVTRNNLSGQQRTDMRKASETVIHNFAESIDYNEFVQGVLKNVLTDQIRTACDKIAPMRTVEIRSFFIDENTKKARFSQAHDTKAVQAETA